MGTIDAALKQAYMELGKAYYEGRYEDPLPELLPLFDRITRLKMKPLFYCPNCGQKVEEGEAYCSHCGEKM